MMFTPYVMFLAFLGTSGAYGWSKNVLDHINYVNGQWDNKEQVALGEGGHVHMIARWTPVNVPVLRSENPILLVEQSIDGVIYVLNLAVLTDGPENSIFLKLYNFTDFTNIKPNSYNIENLSEVKLEDLKTDDDCFASFKIAPHGVDIGDYPYCRYSDNGIHPRFMLMFSCDAVTIITPRGTNEVNTTIPIIGKRASARFPLKSLPNDYAPKDYVSPCN